VPILIEEAPVAVGSLYVDLGEIPFNRDSTMKVHTLDGWWNTSGRNALMSSAPVRGAVGPDGRVEGCGRSI
jgi:hypothetical protein